MQTTEPTVIKKFFLEMFYTIIAALIILSVLLYPFKVRLCGVHLLPLKRKTAFCVSVVMLAGACTHVAVNLEIPQFVAKKQSRTLVYDRYYVNPQNARLKFPDRKRNLILIYMESIETTYLSKELGGARSYNLIPNLGKMAMENINFSQSSGIGGPQSIPGTGWTIAALFGSMSGVPLSLPIEGNCYTGLGSFAPGAYSLGDILKENGYNLRFVTGADSAFAGTNNFLTFHGGFVIKDVFSAEKEGVIGQGRRAWWGLEDKTLFRYAKKELVQLEKSFRQHIPFCFVMATLDTHHVGGWICDLCSNKFSHQNENVIACADRQIAAFLNWAEKQAFYDNTTIVIIGDHLSMEPEYFKDIQANYSRHPYNVFINSAIETKSNKNRIFTTLDYYPTILASLGVKISGERLGLGTNLFSGKKTLAEILGIKQLREELGKTSDLYNEKILYRQK